MSISAPLYRPRLQQRKVFLCRIGSFLTVGSLLVLPVFAKLSPLAPPPKWNKLDAFQKTITREEFSRLLKLYAPNGAGSSFIFIDGDRALIRRTAGSTDFYKLSFARDEATARTAPRYWKPLPENKLRGVKIALDPGHLGGPWARMEERWFKIGDAKPVTEGDLTLLVASKIAEKLQALGAEVAFVRSETVPLTDERPNRLQDGAAASLKAKGVVAPPMENQGPNDPARENSIRWESERLFYRVAEIRSRSKRNNFVLKPDLTLCLHFNAAAWGDPEHPKLVPENHLHLLVNGNYSREEIAFEDIRFEMLRKMLSQSLDEELALSEKVAKSLAAATGLPPYKYTTPNAQEIGASGFVWLRDLLANRLYQNPTLYLEPYVMNNQQVFDRIQLGDYSGTKLIDGVERKNIFEEYADAVVDGLLKD